jgi:hypothetical protein
VTAFNGLERRLTSLEGTLALFASSFNSRHISTRELCVSDDSGAQTCITKAQLDAVLASMARAAAIEPSPTVTEVTAAAPVEPAEASEPSATAIEAKAPALVEPAEVDEPLVTVTEASALVEPAEETTGVASLAPAAMAEEIAPREQEPAHTGSVSLPSSGAALVWHPEVEVSIPAPVPSSE